MPKTTLSRRSARPRIESAARDLFGRRGIAATTVGDIARRAGCSQAAIYKHWESKDALARRLFETGHQELIGAMDAERARWGEPSEQAIGALLGFVRFSRAHPGPYALLFQVFHSEYSRWLARLRKPSDVLREAIEEGMKAGSIPPGEAALKAALLLGMGIRLAMFERQNLIRSKPAEADAELTEAAAGVLGV
jgi:AcrR family transcriptional regulator